jgi:ankyrin repeat protein
MHMPVGLNEIEVAQIQERYSYLVNYEADDPEAPIDPLSYTDSNGDHLLHIAAQRDDASTVELLLRAGICVDQLGDMGCTALHYARAKKHDDVVALLLAHGASQAIRNNFGQLP